MKLKKLLLGAGLAMSLVSVSAVESSALNNTFSNVYYSWSPIDFTPKVKKYTESSYLLNTDSTNAPAGSILLVPRANRKDVPTEWKYIEQKVGYQEIPNLAVETFGPGCDADISFRLSAAPWDKTRYTSAGTWQPDRNR